ncbi:zinc-dependent alcohol dehydrogenase family protein [Herbidospora sp. RD11066]
MKALQLRAHGDPSEVVELVDVPDVGAPGPDEVVIDVEASPIEPTDLYIIAGGYGVLPPLPHVLGAQGVGRVSAVGGAVKYLEEGDRTLVPPLSNAWAQQVKMDASWLRPLPEGDVAQLSMLGINPPTAFLLLTEFVPLKPGDWVIQNGANSSVGRSVIAIAKARGIKTVNVVRRPELIDQLTELGGDVVLADGPDLPERVAAATGRTEIALALDGVGGSSTQRLLDSLPRYGILVVYAGMSGEPATVSSPDLVFTGQSIRGFWIVNWFGAQTDADRVAALYQEVAPFVASGAISFPVAGRYGLEQYPEALAAAGKYHGKAIFEPNRS